MLKSEFDERWGSEVSPEFYKVVEAVYRDAPWVPDVGGKDVLVKWLKGSSKAVQAFEAVASDVATLERIYFEQGDVNHRLHSELEKARDKVQCLTGQLESTQTQLAQLNESRMKDSEAYDSIVLEKNEYISGLERDLESSENRFAQELALKDAEIVALKAELYDASKA